MKKIFFVLSMMWSTMLFSQVLPVQNAAGDTILNYNTTISCLTTIEGMVLLHFDGNGDIKDINEHLVAHYNAANGVFTDINNDVIGSVNSEGIVFNVHNSVSGIIENNGEVKDHSDSILYRAPGIDKYKSAYLFFLSTIMN